jgi:hypothetical protein
MHGLALFGQVAPSLATMSAALQAIGAPVGVRVAVSVCVGVMVRVRVGVRVTVAVLVWADTGAASAHSTTRLAIKTPTEASAVVQLRRILR